MEETVDQLRARIIRLEDRIEFLYKHLNINIEYLEDPNLANAKVVEFLKRGNKIEAIKIYREIYNVGLAEAKKAVEEIATRQGL